MLTSSITSAGPYINSGSAYNILYLRICIMFKSASRLSSCSERPAVSNDSNCVREFGGRRNRTVQDSRR